MKEKVFVEFGFGNRSFISSEIENSDEEYRISGFIKPKRFNEIYLRFWICKKVFILSSRDGFKVTKKKRNKLKLLFGLGGFR